MPCSFGQNPVRSVNQKFVQKTTFACKNLNISSILKVEEVKISLLLYNVLTWPWKTH